ncbi:hypothetical protein GCM10010276_87090 [Streptomyces longisporus]|uniref:Transposase n=1 Tax=Streptomyces longisporus TaxID=1948 RepID=A0ABN3NHW7_STRLO
MIVLKVLANIAAHTQLRLALPLAADRRRPCEKTTRTGTALPPTRVRRGFRNITSTLTSAVRPAHPYPPGQGQDDHPAPRTATPPPATDVGKPQTTRDTHRPA